MDKINIPCNSCANGSCGSCVGDKLEIMGYIRSAKHHCSCANNGHSNNMSKKLPNKTILGSKKDTEPAHPKEVHTNSDDEYGEDE